VKTEKQLLAEAVDRLDRYLSRNPLGVRGDHEHDRDWAVALFRLLKFGGLPRANERRAATMRIVHLVLDDLRLDR